MQKLRCIGGKGKGNLSERERVVLTWSEGEL